MDAKYTLYSLQQKSRVISPVRYLIAFKSTRATLNPPHAAYNAT
jgi:hypothetical protein